VRYVKLKDLVFIANSFPQIRILKWLNYFSDKGWNVHLFVCKGDLNKQSVWIHDYNIYEFGEGNKLDMNPFSFKRYKKIKNLISDHDIKPDLIVVRDIFQSNVAIKISKQLKVPVILDIADNYPEVSKQLIRFPLNKFISSFYNFVEHIAVKNANLVVTVTNTSASLIKDKHKVASENIVTVRNLPPMETVELIEKNNTSVVDKIVYIGTYSAKIRDLNTVIKSLPIIEKKLKRVIQLDIFTFNIEKVELLAKSILGETYSKYVNISGPIKNHLLHNELKKYTAGVIPHYRGSGTDYTEPNKLYDYVHSQIPVIVSDNPSLVETVNKYRVGEVFQAQNVTDFTNKVIKVYKNKDIYKINCNKYRKELVWHEDMNNVKWFIK